MLAAPLAALIFGWGLYWLIMQAQGEERTGYKSWWDTYVGMAGVGLGALVGIIAFSVAAYAAWPRD